MKKILFGLAALTALAGCSGQSNNANKEKIRVDMANNNPPHALASSNEELDWISQSILDKGMDFMKSGISSLATYAFKTACLEMGIDVRDATTKKIDQIISQLKEITNQIAKGFQDLTNKTQWVRDCDKMDKVLEILDDVRSPVLVEMQTLESIAAKENIPDYDQDFLEQQKTSFVEGFKDKLIFYSLSNQVWHSTELLAKKLLYPNPTKKTQTLMDLYDNTLGANEVWDYQGYAPRIQFIQECAFLVNSLALLSKLEAAREISKYQPGDSNIDGIKQSVVYMCDAVNAINEMFQAELKKLDVIKQNHDDEDCPTMSHIQRTFDSAGFVHISTDYTVSAYLATISLEDVVWKNTVADYYSDSYSHCFKSFKAEESIYNLVYSDYSNYINCCQVEEGYNLKYYLRDLGFRVPESRQEEFDDAIGFYKDINVTHESRGFLRGTDYYAGYRYYDWNGDLKTNRYCRVGETFWKKYDDEEIYSDAIKQKMVTFVNKDNTKLEGSTIWTIAHRIDDKDSKLIDHFYKGTSYNDTDYASYKVK